MTAADTRSLVLSGHMEIIVQRCRNAFGTVGAVVLYGGYGRGEGSWFRDASDLWQPYNDYDLVVVCEKRLPMEQLAGLRQELAAEIGIRWLDISAMGRTKLRRLRPSIFNYDLKYASTVVFGDPGIRDLIPVIDPTRLPLREILTLFLTRLWTLLGPLDQRGFRQTLTADASMFFRNQMAKAVLAVVDVLLLLKGAYHPSYRVRVERVLDLRSFDASTSELMTWALEEKLRPRGPTMEPARVKELYDEVHTLFFRYMIEALSRYYGKPLNTADDIARAYRWHWNQLLRRLFYPLVRRSLRMERLAAVDLAQIYIASAYTPSAPVEPEYLAKGIRFLREIKPALEPDLSWNQARLIAAELRMLV